MTIVSGSRLGPYEIVAPIGAGGMGEVYRARDTRLDRSVAIKILPQEFADNAQLKLRFEREARTISQLNHPNICTVHDVGSDNGTSYLVMEYLEGETLADRLVRGSLALRDVLRFGAQIAEALAKAHAAGIVHRDLKPANVMITTSGAKLLDFGLARPLRTAAPVTDATQHKPLTQEGTIVGTFQYMAPEQLAGEDADARTDIFALGAVLYEMLTGARAFQGKTKTSLIAAIVGGEPQPVSHLQPLTPAALDHVITKCLAKEREERWQSASDVASELEWISRSSSPANTPQAVTRHVTRRRLVNVALALAAIVAMSAIAAAAYLYRRMSVAERPIRAELMMPFGEELGILAWGPIALSPDGTKLALYVGPRGHNMIAVRDLASGELKKLPGTEQSQFPFWSPDSKQIGFFLQGKLKTTLAAGGPVQDICNAPQGRGGSWSSLGIIVFTPETLAPIYKVDAGGGTPVAVTKATAGWTHRNPVFLPDGKTFLFNGRDSSGMAAGGLYAGSVDGKLQKLIISEASNAAYSDGRVFFLRSRNLVAQAFDTRKLALTGTPAPVADHIDYYNPRDIGNFSVAGEKIVYTSALPVPLQISIYDRTGKQIETRGAPGEYHLLDVSADGKTLALEIGGESRSDVWTMQLDRGVLSRTTFFNLQGTLSAVFSPDGRRMAVAHGTVFGGSFKVAMRSLDSTATEDLIENPTSLQVREWSRDGKYLLVTVQNIETSWDIGYIDIQQRKVVLVVHSRAEEFQPALSPNGKWLAYFSTESGGPQIYVTRFPSGEGKWQVTADGGIDPRWSHDGKRLFFINRRKLQVVDVGDGPTPQIGTPRALSIEPFDPNAGVLGIGYAETADGRIITLTRVGDLPPNPIHLITNWEKLLPR